MAKKIKPSEISVQVNYEPAAAADFAADLLEDVNDHNMAAVLRAVNAGEYDLACEFIQVEKRHLEAGHLTTELRDLRDALLVRLRQALGS